MIEHQDDWKKKLARFMQALLSAACPLAPALWFGLQGKPTEMGLAIVAGSVAAAFLNMDKLQSFKGGGFEAQMRDMQKVKEDAYATIESLRDVAKPMVETTLHMLTMFGRIGGVEWPAKHEYQKEIERLCGKIGIDSDPAIQSANGHFFRMHTWDHFSHLVEHVRRSGGGDTVLKNLRDLQQYESVRFPSRQMIETTLGDCQLDAPGQALLEDYLYYKEHREIRPA